MANRALVGLLGVVLILRAAAAADKPEEGPGAKVVAFCKQNLGKQVGDGECASLASAALKAAGATARSKFPDDPNPGDYVWGDLVYALKVEDGKRKEEKVKGKSVQPGDVIQFRDAKFAGRRPGGGTYSSSSPHHTAVVVEVRKPTQQLVILQQNTNGRRYVVSETLTLNDLKAGWLRFYRPVTP